MKAFALLIGLACCAGLSARAADDKLDIAGKYALVAGKKFGADVDEKSKKATYTITADQITIAGGEFKFVMGYKIDASKKPATIDMEIQEGPEGGKGTPAVGIVELKGDVLKLAYSLDKDKRPKDFDGKAGFYMELKKEKKK
jgi:uncharacterized protein (TIGR03067 family)